MDCLEVQQLLSEAIDGEPVDAGRLSQARAHCSSCAACGAFVQGLAIVHRTPPPEEPAGLSDRVVEAVRDEAARAAETAAAATAVAHRATSAADEEVGPAATGALPARVPGAPATGPGPQGVRARKRMSPVAIGAWVGAAAAVLILVSFAAISGVRTIVSPDDTARTAGSAESSFQTAPSVTDEGLATAPSDGAKDAAEADVAASAAGAANMIAVEGFAYRRAGVVSDYQSTLTTYTTTTTSLGSGAAPQPYTVFKTPAGGRLALVRDGETWLFDIVRRRYQGSSFALTSGPLESFEEWPTLPASIPVPTTPEGAPTFVSAGSDDSGAEVYRLPTTPASQGFAVPPGRPSSDPVGGSPNWTWWVPAQ